MSRKYAYYRDGECPQIVVRRTYGDGEGLAALWDYKEKKWVPSADAWETIDDERGN